MKRLSSNSFQRNLWKLFVVIFNIRGNFAQFDWYGMNNYQPLLPNIPNQQQVDISNQWDTQQQQQQQQQQVPPRDDFLFQMCREREYRLNWELILDPCKNNLEFGPTIYSSTDRTNVKYSKIINKQIKESGEYTSFVIKTFDNNNQPKNIGGDTIRVFINGTASLESFVYDINNGEYETAFLVLEAGVYFVDIILEGSLCSSFVNPPLDWFNKGDYNGHFQTNWMYKDKQGWPFLLDERLWNRIAKFQINVRPGISNRIKENMKKLSNWKSLCNVNRKCNFLKDGFGRWIGHAWKPFNNALDIRHVKTKPRAQQGTFWIYGDCYAYHLYENLWNQTFCIDLFRTCKKTYNWIYPRKSVDPLFDVTIHLKDNRSMDIPWLTQLLKRVLTRKDMDGPENAMLINLGLHFVRAASFEQYKLLIDQVIKVIKASPADVVWRTTTGIYKQEDKTHKRFQTHQRAFLFNAYSMSAMCDAGIPIIDVFPKTSSYPYKPKDGIHFDINIFQPAIEILQKYFQNL